VSRLGDRVISKAVRKPDQFNRLVKALRDVLAGLGLTSHNKAELKRRRHRVILLRNRGHS
jgi:hypothetical protein